MICKRYGDAFWWSFKKECDTQFGSLIAEFENMGQSMFAFNYAYAPSYVAWYKAMEKNGLDKHGRDVLMLLMNEKMLLTVPTPLLHAVGKAYMNNMRKSAGKHLKRQNAGKLHPLDWTVEFRDIDRDRFEIDIKKCGFITYAKKYGAEGMLPAICQVDYMVSHYMKVGFERTKILSTGCDCCDGKYCISGSCDFDIEKRLREKK